MFSEFAFLEYSVTPEHLEDINFSLTNLGYIPIAEHINQGVVVWQLNLSIIFVNEDLDISMPCLSGIGFVCDQECINQFGASYDENIDMYVSTDPRGCRVLMCPVNSYERNQSLLNDRYVMNTISSLRSLKTLEYTSGAVMGVVDDSALEFYASLGFKITKQGTHFLSMVSENNRFTLLFSRDQYPTLPAIILDTDDIFQTTAELVNKQIPLTSFESNVADIGNLNFKIRGYNCIAAGNEQSYTIENSAPHLLPNMNFIFRQRKQYLHVQEDTLKEHFNAS